MIRTMNNNINICWLLSNNGYQSYNRQPLEIYVDSMWCKYRIFHIENHIFMTRQHDSSSIDVMSWCYTLNVILASVLFRPKRQRSVCFTKQQQKILLYLNIKRNRHRCTWMRQNCPHCKDVGTDNCVNAGICTYINELFEIVQLWSLLSFTTFVWSLIDVSYWLNINL